VSKGGFIKLNIFLILTVLSFNIFPQSNFGIDQNQVDAVINDCLGRDWTKENCRYDNDEERANENMNGLMQFIVDGIQHLVRNRPIQLASSPTRDKVLEILKNEVKTKNIFGCKIACLTKCATNALLDHEYNFYSKYGTISNLYTCKTGVCTEFSNLFDDISDNIGIQSRTIYSSEHAYNQVKIDNDWKYIEPQGFSCRFF